MSMSESLYLCARPRPKDDVMTRDEAKQASYVHMCTVHLILLEVLKVAFTASSVPPMIRLLVTNL